MDRLPAIGLRHMAVSSGFGCMQRGFTLVAENLGIASAGAGTTVRVCMDLSLMTIQSSGNAHQ